MSPFLQLELDTPEYHATLSADLRHGTITSHDDTYSITGSFLWLQTELASVGPDPMLEALQVLGGYGRRLTENGWEGFIPPQGDVFGVTWDAPPPTSEDLMMLLELANVRWSVEIGQDYTDEDPVMDEGVHLEVECFDVFVESWELQGIV